MMVHFLTSQRTLNSPHARDANIAGEKRGGLLCVYAYPVMKVRLNNHVSPPSHLDSTSGIYKIETHI